MRLIVSTYLDILTDGLVVFTILGTVGVESLWYFPGKLTSVIIFCMIVSILCPLWLSCFLNAREEIKAGEYKSFASRLAIYSKTFLFAFLKPMIILNSYEANKQEMKAAVMRRNDKEHILKLMRNGHQLKIQYVNFIRVDLGIGKF